jgi:VanZ family protein
LLWLCLITYLSNAKSDGIPDFPILAFKGADKLVHAIFYLNLMLAMSWGFTKQGKFQSLKSNKFLFSFLFCIVWGAFMELCQLFIFTYRSAEWADLLANTIGAGTGLIISSFLWKLNKIS